MLFRQYKVQGLYEKQLLTFKFLRQSAKYFLTSESEPGKNLRARCVRCLNEFVSITFNVEDELPNPPLPLHTSSSMNLKLCYSTVKIRQQNCAILYRCRATGMEETPKAALDIHCLRRGGRVALTSTIN